MKKVLSLLLFRLAGEILATNLPIEIDVFEDDLGKYQTFFYFKTWLAHLRSFFIKNQPPFLQNMVNFCRSDYKGKQI